MAFLNGCGIDIKTITELAAEGLSLNSVSKVTGHSKNGIQAALIRNNIPYTKHVKERFIGVDGVMMSLKDRPILTFKNATVLYKKERYTLDAIIDKLRLNKSHFEMFMRQNRYCQNAFERYCWMRGL